MNMDVLKTIMSRSRKVTPFGGLELSDMGIKPGELVGFDNSDTELPQPFLIARVGNWSLKKYNREFAERLKKLPLFENSLLLIQSGKNSLDEAYLLDTVGKLREIWSQSYRHGIKIAETRVKKTNPGSYVFESAYIGRENVIDALRKRADLGFDFYAEYLESIPGRLMVRGR